MTLCAEGLAFSTVPVESQGLEGLACAASCRLRLVGEQPINQTTLCVPARTVLTTHAHETPSRLVGGGLW